MIDSTRPRVLLDATAIPRDRGGVGRYVEELAAAAAPGLSIVTQARDAARFKQLAPDADVISAPRWIRRRSARLLWEQLGLPAVARRAGCAVIHSPHYTVPILTRRRRVVTFHDGTFFSEPSVHSRGKRLFFRAWTRAAARMANAIVVPSDATGREIQSFVPVAGGKWITAHHGVDQDEFHPPDAGEVAAFAAANRAESGWIAFLGTLEPRKNLRALVDAHAILSRTIDLPPLLLAGAPGWDSQLDASISASPSGNVRRLGYIPASSLPAFLGGAELVVYPSLGEGFGLPVLEAMACGAAVLTTPRLALPEVGGDAVAYTEPDTASIAEALGDLLADPTRRKALAEAGRARAAEFTWAACWRQHERAFAYAVGVAG